MTQDGPRAGAPLPADERPRLVPGDAHDAELLERVHPPSWKNPEPRGPYNLVVVGGGTAGLVCAAGAAGVGARVALVERSMMGGDCLNFGCVPSKALIAAARAELSRGQASANAETGSIRFAEAMRRLRCLRAGIAHNDSVERFTKLGVDVFLGHARFAPDGGVEVEGRRLKGARAVIATGTRPTALSAPGAARAGYLTNETVFALTALPRRLAVVGGGPIGCELAQAFRRFGAEVTLLTRGARILSKEDPDASVLLQEVFRREGIRVCTGARIEAVSRETGVTTIAVSTAGGKELLAVDEILVAIGRQANVDGLGLAESGIAHDAAGVHVDDFLQSSRSGVYAAGDICSRFKFTHAADAMARIVIQNALFFGRKRASSLVIPWCTYTDPEVAQVGLTSNEARAAGAATFTVQMAEVDRAVLDGETEGFARVHADARSGKILGATMVAPHAGERIGELALAMTAGLGLGRLASTIHPYPTQAEAWKRLGDAYMRTKLRPWVRGLLETIMRWRR